ncbi:MAG: DUF1573 domain-containing protein [Ignavibacteriales bacterium]
MKNKIFFMMILAVSIFAQKQGAKISAVEPKYDFGEITEGQRVSHEFVVKNEGDETLEIRKINASCGCTAAQPDKDRLAPGESTKIKVFFDSSNRQGKQVKYVYVMTNDQANPQIRLEFTCDIQPRLVSDTKEVNGARLIITPNKFDFGDVKEGKIVSTNIFLKNIGNSQLVISSINSSSDNIKTSINTTKLNQNENAVMKVELDTSKRAGKFTRTITISANDSVEPNQTIVIFANIIKD